MKKALYTIIKDDKFGFINHAGEITIPPRYSLAREFSEDLAAVCLNSKWGLIDTHGEMVIKPDFSELFPFQEGLAAAKIDDKYGFINKDGEFVIDPEFASVSSFSEGLALVGSSDGIFEFIDKTGKTAFQIDSPLDSPLDSPRAENFSCGLALIYSARIGAYKFFDNAGTAMFDSSFCGAGSFSEGLAPVQIEDLWGYINPHGSVAITPEFEWASGFSEGLAVVRYENKLTFIGKDGSFINEEEYENLWEFYEGISSVGAQMEGWRPVRRGENNMVIPSFDQARPFSEGLAAVEIAGRWGYVDSSGRFTINPRFLKAGDFKNGLAGVNSNGVKNRWSYINKYGRTIWKTED